MTLSMTSTQYNPRDKDYDHRRETDITYQQACSWLDRFTWAVEAQHLLEDEECGGMQFFRQESSGATAEFDITPEQGEQVMISLYIEVKKGFLGIGRQATRVDFQDQSLAQTKALLRHFFSLSCESLYKQYKKTA